MSAPLEEVIGAPVQKFVAVEDREAFRGLLERGSGTHRGRLMTSGGRMLEVYLSLTAAISDSVEQRSLIVADLTELADAQSSRDRAERENRAKDEFMAMLAHELRNPLGAIAGAIQVLDAVGSGEGPEVHARGVITRQVRHLSCLVNDLLDASRVVTGKVALVRSPVNVGELVRDIVAIATADPRLERHIEVHTDPLWTSADPVRLEEIVGNLVDNAIKYTAAGGHIRVSVTAEDPYVLLRVDDDGIGIPHDLMPRIFDLFVQGDVGLDRAKGGLGIGLTLVRRLVEMHGGLLSAASDGPNRGSSFTVRLARIAASEKRPVDAAAAPPLQRRRVLVIEDNQDAREMYRLVFELEGHDVLEAEDGARGLELLKSEHPDIALVDIGLPRLDGYELARRFRAEPGADRTVLVALTGYGSTEDVHRSRQLGFDYHLIKPVSAEAVRRLLNGSIGRATGRHPVIP